jgi:hypothetical protein
MAAFDRVLSGIPQMDDNVDNIRLGDNVVCGTVKTHYGPCKYRRTNDLA